MFDNNSDYALNKKDKDSIVYKGCDGYEQRISREQFATEEEFLFWKSWSDKDYRETDYKDAYYYRHIVQLNSTGTSPVTVSSPEEMMIGANVKGAGKNRSHDPSDRPCQPDSDASELLGKEIGK